MGYPYICDYSFLAVSVQVMDYRIKTCSLVTYRGTLPYVVIVLGFVSESYMLWKLDL